MFISSENSAAVITSNPERKILVLAGSFFDKIHCMYWTTRFTFSWKVHFKKSLCHSICLKILVLQEENGEK